MTIAGLLAVPEVGRHLKWLRRSLQLAVQIEFATLPPYLCAMWSIEDQNSHAAKSISTIVYEEMLHFGFVCNILNALGETPKINTPGVVPKYPGPLPGKVRPGLIVPLQRLTPSAVKDVFMEIEFPMGGPIPLIQRKRGNPTIGDFYDAIARRLKKLSDADLKGGKQLTEDDTRVPLTRITNKKQALAAIQLIKEQGEGTTCSPEDPTPPAGDDDLAHYYRFQEIFQGEQLVKGTDGKWRFDATKPVPLPGVYPMARIPEGGYTKDKTPPTIYSKILAFDRLYTDMLGKLQEAWATGDSTGQLGQAKTLMIDMTTVGRELMQIELRKEPKATYGPCFRLTVQP